MYSSATGTAGYFKHINGKKIWVDRKSIAGSEKSASAPLTTVQSAAKKLIMRTKSGKLASGRIRAAEVAQEQRVTSAASAHSAMMMGPGKFPVCKGGGSCHYNGETTTD